jgi:predicted nucleic acid-binding protein
VAELFVDTSAWYSAVVASHGDHSTVAEALHDALAAGARLVTTNLVVMETHALLLHRANRGAALTFARTVYEPPTVVVTSDLELERSAITDWLSRYGDQDFSLADGVSFAVMKSRGISRALTLDAHFGIGGFEVLPATRPRRRSR